jgi:uncharacterized protein
MFANTVQDTLAQYTKTLTNTIAFCDKAAQYADSKKFEVANLLNARLAPDQFNFIRQIQIATDVAKGAAARLSGQEPPKWEDNEATLSDVKARLQKTVDYLKTMKAENFKDAETRKIVQPRTPDQYLTGKEFFYEHAMPNFFFHITTAYAILRHNGVEVGKKDYLGTLSYKKL